ncbi:MAG: PHP domain-containing protein [Xanthomonadales bacterium]|nr:PHP domain-containing protein [Xanthomonadales bacterium]
MIFDLHSHTTRSDGLLAPRELLNRALEQGVDVLAITDHDTVDAYRDLPAAVQRIALVAGVEFSTRWEHTGIHVLALDIDLASAAIDAAVRFQTAARLTRARRIAEILEKMGVEDALAGTSGYAADGYIGRPHFARHLVAIGRASSVQDAFKRFLGDGKSCDVKQHWAELPQIVRWICEGGGIAVLAHPLKYKLTRTKLKRLLSHFVEVGGQGLEVISGQQEAQHTAAMAQLCEQHGLLASAGSDFHGPGKPWAELGAIGALPDNVTPVWERFS